MTRIASGVTDQYVYFVAVDATDLKTRETGLTTWTVYRSRNGAAAAAMTTPTINETDSVNMPGVYELLLDEDMTIDAGDETQEMVFHITHSGMAPVTRVIELYRPKITAGNTLDVTATGAAGIDWGNVENPTTSLGLTNTTVGIVTTLTGHTAQTGDCFARIGATGSGLTSLASQSSMDTVAGYLDTEIAAILADTNELQTDWANGGRLDLILDARASQTSVDTVDDFLDTEIAALTTELAKVPKSDGTATWNATALASLQQEATDALNAYDPPTNAEMEARTPTASQLAYIVANAATGLPVTFTTSGGSTTAAVLNTVDGAASSATNDQYNGRLLVFTDGTLKGVVTDITDYVGSTTTATITAIPFAPTASHNARLI